jgi:type VI secretion system protein VasD
MMRSFFLIFCGLYLFGCASEPSAPPPVLPPSLVQLQIDASNTVNPGNNGEASPIMLKIYELRESSSFNTADFFALFNNDKAILGGDLVRKSELILKPGESKSLEIKPGEDVQSLGFFAAFRQLDNAQWRTSVKIEKNQTQLVGIRLVGNQVTLDMAH